MNTDSASDQYEMSRSSRTKRIVAWVVLLLLLIPALLLIAKFTPSPGEICCDAEAYVKIAQGISANGLWQRYDAAETRTYLFPFILSILGGVAQTSFDDYLAVYGQQVLWIFAAVYLAVLVLLATAETTDRALVVGAFLLNPILLTYVPMPLSESHYLLFFTILFALMFVHVRLLSRIGNPAWCWYWPILVAFIGLTSGALVQIRPAAVTVAAASAITIAVACIAAPADSTGHGLATSLFRKLGMLLTAGCAWALGFMVVAIPQVLINMRHFHRVTFLPTRDLGNLQFYWGLLNFKYATMLVKGHSPRMFYPSTALIGDATAFEAEPLRYYVDEPLKGFLLFVIHIYQSLNYDFLHVYLTDDTYAIVSWHQILSSLLTIAGILGLMLTVIRFRTRLLTMSGELFAIIALCLSSLLTGLVAVETRFGIVALGVLSFFALRFLVVDGPGLALKSKIVSAVIVLAYIVASCAASYYFVRVTNQFEYHWL